MSEVWGMVEGALLALFGYLMWQDREAVRFEEAREQSWASIMALEMPNQALRELLSDGVCANCGACIDYDSRNKVWRDMDGYRFCPVEDGGGAHEPKEDE